MIRVEDLADPERCQGKAPDGQCRNKREVGSDYCFICGHGFSMAKAEDLRLYHLTEARSSSRLAELSGHDAIHALREIIALATRLVERRVNAIESDAEFLEAYRDLNTLQLTVLRLKKSANLIERSLGDLLGKPSVLRFGQHVIQIVVEELRKIEGSEQIVERIANQIVRAIVTASNDSIPVNLNITALVDANRELTFKIDNLDDHARIVALTKHERIKSLHEDIGLQIMFIERYWGLIKNKTDLISAAGPLCTGLRTLEDQIKSAHNIEQTLGNLLTSETVKRLGSQISEIIADELARAQVPDFEFVADEIMERLANEPMPTTPRIAA